MGWGWEMQCLWGPGAQPGSPQGLERSDGDDGTAQDLGPGLLCLGEAPRVWGLSREVNSVPFWLGVLDWEGEKVAFPESTVKCPPVLW